ncbi:D-lactate dehydrogenase cytochrome oxidoreductase [Pyrrhoderma noxium]|uniref:25S rRNA adenine-N(1) methyltransferase n=1 Tax=Pyrrhoderma noxium TaxID=2282107 RepID=A0A286UW03_9AGAM|nr:D-lactate dehydrogenase cytochrome oxidoreductase [Pyrrhoderma noxium]
MGGSVNPATSARIIRRFHVLLKRRAQLERERDVRIRKSERRARREDQEYEREGEGGLVSSSGHVPGYGSGSGSSLGRTGGLGGVEEIEQKLGEVEEEMERIGGLEVYQRMSSIGQGKDRGGGSEKVLIGWLRELGYGSPTEGIREGSNSNLNGKGKEKETRMRKIKLLEVGALKPDNYASCSLWVEVLPIDLRSQYPGIIEQDFLLMDQEANEGKWDAISLSLVVNFVPEPKNRGKMLRYAHSMLRENGLLFLALPLPCVSNSRYLTFEHLKSLMDHIGFDTLRERWKDGGKMAYWLFQKQRNDNTKEMFGSFPRVNLNTSPKSKMMRTTRTTFRNFSVWSGSSRLGVQNTSFRRYNSATNNSGKAPSQRVAYGILASVAFFSAVFGYSVSEWIRHEARSGKDANEGVERTWQDVKYGSPEDVHAAIEELKKAFPREHAVNTEPKILQSYGFSEASYHPSSPHAVVVRPHSTEEVSTIVKIANKYKIPVTPYGGGTSLEGHFSGSAPGSICIDMDGMNKIIRIDENDGDLICQAGARWEDINSTLKEKGIPLFFPLDPGPGATIGGMIGTGCSGTNAVRYGTAKGEWFLNVTVVLPNGEIIKTRRRARKSSAGFDTTKLFIGAEGTLGIVTEATLRLAPLLPTKVAFAQFPDVQHAVDAVQEILASPYGSSMQCVELVDDYTISTINAAGTVDRTYPIRDSLFFKIQGSEESIKAAAKTVQAIVKRHGSSMFQFATTDEEASALWEARKYALWSVIASEEGSRAWTTDVCVPTSKLPQLVQETKRDIAESGLKAGVVGHVGDGNFHALILFNNDEELQKVGDCVHRLVHRALALDGTCTGEHGVGVGKKEYLNDELGEGTVSLMKRVKNAIDPSHIMNPGKLYPDNDKNTKNTLTYVYCVFDKVTPSNLRPREPKLSYIIIREKEDGSDNRLVIILF